MAKKKIVRERKEAKTDTTWPVIASFVSLILPGIGLLFSGRNKVLGLVILIMAVVADLIIAVVAGIGTLCLVGIVLWLLIPVVHVLAAIHTYDTFMKERGSKPILFR